MKPAVLKILAFICLFTPAVSCKKSGTDAPAKSKTILLTQASWKIKNVSMDADRNGTADTGGDLTSNIPACQLDNTYTFKTDGTGTMDEAAAKCNSTDPQTKLFTWVFTANETVLSGTFSFTRGDATLVSMNDTNMVIAYDDNFGTSTSYHLLATLQH